MSNDYRSIWLVGHRWGDYLTSYGANVKKVIAEPGNVPSIDDVKKAFEEFDQVKALFVVYNESSIFSSYGRSSNDRFSKLILLV